MGVGKVYLIGAGPGAYDLITIRGRRALCQADLIICDYLVPVSFLEDLGVRSTNVTVERLTPGPGRKGQAEINAMMRDAARQGRVVARLKCGDPFVFGRGAEEIDFLEAEQVPWEVIPGLSAYVGTGLPLTHRGSARSFAVVTAREAGGDMASSWPRADSLVVFMGVSAIGQAAAGLLRDGWAPDTPAAVAERATLPWERRVFGTLADIARVAEQARVAAPALLIVGRAASREHTFFSRPRILYTGLDASNFRFIGNVVHWPALQAVADEEGAKELPQVLARLARREFDWIIFTSRVGVRSFFRALEENGHDARALAGATVVTAGTGTDLLLRECGVRADLVPGEAGTGGILAAMSTRAAGSVLLVQGSHAMPRLESELGRRGWTVARLALHRVIPNPDLGRPLPEHDVVYFASPSGVRAFWQAYGEEAFKREVWCVGEITLGQVARLGFRGKAVNPHVPSDQNETVPAH